MRRWWTVAAVEADIYQRDAGGDEGEADAASGTGLPSAFASVRCPSVSRVSVSCVCVRRAPWAVCLFGLFAGTLSLSFVVPRGRLYEIGGEATRWHRQAVWQR
eukprot:2977774-Prymnesium_polylepis.1